MMKENAAAGAPGGTQSVDSKRWLALSVVLVAPFMAIFDVFVVNVAIPTMQRDLHATFSELQFVITMYALAYAVTLITGGRLGDLYGRKRLFIVGMAGFIVASAACGLAPNVRLLVVARVAQGLAAALMSPQVLSMIQVTFPPNERPRALSIYGAVLGFAAVAALTGGGLVIRSDIFGWGWRAVFLLNVPIGAVALFLASRWLQNSRAAASPSLDLGGMVLIAGALFLLIFPLVQGRAAGWPLWSWMCLVASAITLAGFVLFEHRQAQKNGSPLVVLSLFRQRTFSAGLVVYFLSALVTAALFFILSLYLQLGLGYSAFAAGLVVVPASIGYFIGSMTSAKLAVRFGRNLTLASLVLRACTAAAVAFVIGSAGATLPTLPIALLLFLDGMAASLTTVPMIGVTLRGVPPGDAGSAAGVFTTVTQVASAVGIAIIGVLFFGSFAMHAPTVASDVGGALQHELARTVDDPQVVSETVGAFRTCVVDRARSRHPSSPVPSCEDAALAPADENRRTAVADALLEASARQYGWAYAVAGLFNVAAIVAALLAALALPRKKAST